MKNNTVCFTGHRNIPQRDTKNIEDKLYTEIEKLISEGFTDFISGGAKGFDSLASYMVIKHIKEGKKIRLHMAYPYKRAMTLKDKEINDFAETITYVCEHYHSGCFHERNRFMVDKSAVVVCYLTEDKGGTYYTVCYAKEKDKKIIKIL
ncbi:MAG: SLOG family protein [Clostridia bacterium]|nr:SLOG family protein [Clostridia bacterium]